MRRSHNGSKVVALILLIVSGCASNPPVDQVDLMPAPDVYGDGLINPLPETAPFERIPYDGILFATDRVPATEADEENYYLNDRGEVLRVGVANVRMGQAEFDWDWAREISMLSARTEQYPLTIDGCRRMGHSVRHRPLLDRQGPRDQWQSPT